MTHRQVVLQYRTDGAEETRHVGDVYLPRISSRIVRAVIPRCLHEHTVPGQIEANVWLVALLGKFFQLAQNRQRGLIAQPRYFVYVHTFAKTMLLDAEIPRRFPIRILNDPSLIGSHRF